MKWVWILVLAAFAAGCNKPGKPKKETPPPAKKEEKPERPKVEGPERLEIQIIVLVFSELESGKPVSSRNLDETRKLAHELLEQAKKGGDFDAMVREYTDSGNIPGMGELAYPGIWDIANTKVATIGKETPRDRVPPEFADKIFSLQIGDVGFQDYDPKDWRGPICVFKRVK